MTQPATSSTTALPGGTVTFLFTDIEGSTRLVQALGDERFGREVLAVETRVVEGAATAEGGVPFGSEGDAHFIAFATALAAIRAAAGAQRALASATWPDGGAVRVRMGIHSGEARFADGRYQGLVLHRVARVTSAGHGGQVLVSGATGALVGDGLPEGFELLDLGEHRLKDLPSPERLFQLVAPGLDLTFPPPKTLGTTPHNLPTQLTSFVGRAEVARAGELLAGTRLLTLTGPGGTGKTRLSLELATIAGARFPGAVWFVPLASVTEPGLVPSAIATAVGLTGAGRPPHERVVEYFRDRRALVVLDNFEQVAEAAGFVSDLLHAAPELTVIVTSRSRLRIYGEQEFAVPPLSMPDDTRPIGRETGLRSEAIRLFVERAAAVRADFALTDENAPAIADIVRRLDGLPLAIELAAARVRLLSPVAIRDRLSDRLGLLTGGASDLPERQRTLRAAIDWSYDLLDSVERELFGRLSVFMGGGLLETAELVNGTGDGRVGALAGDVLETIESLAEKSLVRIAEGRHGEPRFVMLETLREYAADRLRQTGDAEGLRNRHANAYMALLESAGRRIYTGDRRPVLDAIEDDHDNVRAALSWLIESGDAVGATTLLAAAWRFWQMRGHLDEGMQRAATVLAMPGWRDLDPRIRLGGLDAAGGLAYWNGDIATAHVRYAEALELARTIGDKRELARALYNIMFAPEVPTSSIDWGRLLAEGRKRAEEALALFRELDDARGIAWGLWGVGESHLYAGEWTDAIRVFTESLDQFRDLDDPFGQGWALFTRGTVHHLAGDIARAMPDARESLRLFSRAGDVSGIALTLAEAARLAGSAGDRERAHRIAGAAARIEEETGTGLASLGPEFAERFGMANIERDATDPVLAAAWAQGEAMSQEEAIAYVLGE